MRRGCAHIASAGSRNHCDHGCGKDAHKEDKLVLEEPAVGVFSLRHIYHICNPGKYLSTKLRTSLRVFVGAWVNLEK